MGAGASTQFGSEAAALEAGHTQEEIDAWKEENPPPTISTTLRTLPDALDTAVYVHEKWPLVVDPTGQAIRFLRYQNGSFLFLHNPADMEPESLRKALIGGLKYGSLMVISFEEINTMEVDQLFSETFFPEQVMVKGDLFKEETWTPLLRPAAGDPTPETFMPKDEFKFIIVTKCQVPPPATASKMCIVNVVDKTKKKEGSVGGASSGSLAVAAAFGIREKKRNSVKLVEAAFDGEWDELKEYLDKGYSLDSEDPHGHTALSEAACKGHKDIVEKLIELGADPNTKSDQGRTPLWRASYNGHSETVRILLEAGADPQIRAGLECPLDVAKDEICEQILSEWDPEVTKRLMAERKAEIERKLEARIKTSAEREAYAREKLRAELVDIVTEGKLDEMKEKLQEIADEALEQNERPRAKAEVRDERGNTLLMIAVWKSHFPIVEFLLTQYKTFDEELDKIERLVFYANVNSKDSKGWNACQIATFHEHKKILELLLEHGANPEAKNSYGKSSFDLAQDEKDAARAVVKDRSEIRGVLMQWESNQNPKAYAERIK